MMVLFLPNGIDKQADCSGLIAWGFRRVWVLLGGYDGIVGVGCKILTRSPFSTPVRSGWASSARLDLPMVQSDQSPKATNRFHCHSIGTHCCQSPLPSTTLSHGLLHNTHLLSVILSIMAGYADI